ncbi:Fc.00g090210.m01.CDS01 [Cosmosporella sp. VM-42]
MAKSRRNRAAHRKDPISKTVKPPSDPELAALRESKILPVIQELKSADPKSRSAAAAAITNIIQDSRCRKLLLREQVVHTVLTQTLTDNALESRAAGWGILQVLAREEEPDFCVHLFRVDILTAIEFAAKFVSETLLSKEPGFQKSPKAEQKVVLSIVSSLVSLLTALAEAQDDILLAIAGNATITNLLFLLSSHKLADHGDVVALRSDALACLMILCEDNPELAGKIVSKDPQTYESLLVLRKEVNSDGVLACGVLHNLFMSLQGQETALDADDSYIIPTLSKALACFQPGQTTNGAGWSNPVECQQLALEILASIGSDLNASADGPEPPKDAEKAPKEDDEDMDDADADADEVGEVEGEEEDEDDEMDQDEMEADMDMVTGADENDETPSLDDDPILKSLIQAALPELIRIATTSPTNDAALRLQALALSALNNIAWGVSLLDFEDSHNASIQRAWTPVGQELWAQVIAPILASDTADVNLASSVTSLAWAVARGLRGSSSPLKADEHRKFITLYQATKGTLPQNQEDPFQALGVKCIGVLGQLALSPCPTPLNREIGTFLITLLAALPNTPTADAVEALNQLFDIYGNEEFDYDKEVFWKDNFLKHMEEVVPKAKAMVKTIDKRAQGELRLRADEAVLNLNRFLAYKRKNKP